MSGLLGGVPLVDVAVQVLKSSVDQDKHEGEKNQSEVGLRSGHKHVEGAELVRCSNTSRNDPIAQNVEQCASNAQEQQPEAYQVG